ncbi:CvfD/Ygs/GSP13 family RNA-binding post-transcriptional regulator [Furfurilactobacillus siliginis]|uniref:Polyribonucleotide nucleotidyltransferase n=1 Tax=Furfurilactobacillus siliginis TaxID=348151 RepID=A0A0R2KVU9_9LACO|nr:CvfD/Ygs/GSP13 family RNA-binding post-transcriptional regulator [Furfurilactobacillus siliginis]KRN93593.1 hypothetical protein IV55_GL001012 [Furfurilactobacillus siliginis]GEK29249.1 polyribonucleotide nucleotidyltransferase [Furfurilactobacillus siliginis]
MTYRIGQIVTGTVTGIQSYGVFVSLDDTHQGLIHISEAKFGYVDDLNQLFKVGESVTAMVLDIDEYSHKISLSLRSMTESQMKAGVTTAPQHKRYWTNWHLNAGFDPIANAMPDWLIEAKRRFIDEHH